MALASGLSHEVGAIEVSLGGATFCFNPGMIQISKLIAQGAGLAPVLVKRAATVELDWDLRQKSRFDATDSLGRQLGVFLPRGTLVRGGDVLLAEDGSMIKVIAAPQPLLRITPCAAHGTAFDLTRAAYHLGKRQVPIELKPDHLKIAPDPVLADMLRAMHLIVNEVQQAFEPEGACGADGHGHSHAAGHAHAPTATPAPAAHVHGPNCNHDHGHTPAPAAATPHVHGPDCNHGHNHAPQTVQPVAIQIHPRKPHSH